jgi:hypothetical protein
MSPWAVARVAGSAPRASLDANPLPPCVGWRAVAGAFLALLFIRTSSPGWCVLERLLSLQGLERHGSFRANRPVLGSQGLSRCDGYSSARMPMRPNCNCSSRMIRFGGSRPKRAVAAGPSIAKPPATITPESRSGGQSYRRMSGRRRCRRGPQVAIASSTRMPFNGVG